MFKFNYITQILFYSQWLLLKAAFRKFHQVWQTVHSNVIIKIKKQGIITIENMAHILQKCPQFSNHPVCSCVCGNIADATFVEICYGTPSFTVRMSQMLWLLEKIFGRKFEDIMGNWRMLHKGDIHNMLTPLLLGCKIHLTEMCNTCNTYIRVVVPIQNCGQKTCVGQVT